MELAEVIVMSLTDQFRPLLDKYPPEYKLIKSQLVADFAKPHEGVWNALHFELLALEFVAIVAHRKSKPKTVAGSLCEALQDAQDRWSHVYQQLRNATDDLDAQALREACRSGGVYQPLELEPASVAVERLGNALLERIGRMSEELKTQTPSEVATAAIRRALQTLDERHLVLATTGAGFVDLRDRLFHKLTPSEDALDSSDSRKTKGLVAASLVVALALSVGFWLFGRDTRTAEQALSQAKAHYKSGEFEKAVKDAETAIAKLKAQGASGPQIHQVRKFLGSAYYKVDDLSAASEQMQILTKAYPDNVEYRKTLAQLKNEQ